MPGPKKRKTRRLLRSASKVQETELLDNARALADDPSLGVPACDGRCVLFCPFKGARRHAAKAQAAKDDPDRLKKLANRGNRIGRAYAAALLAAQSGAVSHFAQARLPFGTYPYVYRGTAKPIFHVAMQHWPDRRLRLLGATDYARRRGLVVYSLDEGMLCTHRRFAPPAEFLEAEMDDLELAARDDGSHTCAHPAARPALVVRWLSAKATLRICYACAGERNTVHTILEHLAARDPTRDFQAEADLEPIQGLDAAPAPDPAPARRLLRGEIGDRAFLEEAEAARLAALRARTGFLLVGGNRSFPDAAAFCAAVGASPHEARAVAAALEGWTRPVVLARASVSLLLEALWKERGREALTAAAGEAGGARLYEPAADAGRIADLVRRAADEGETARVARALPRYRDLAPAVQVADRAARAFRARGKGDATRVATEAGVPRGPAMGVALAILGVFGEDKAQAWKFSKEEQEVAEYVAPEVRILVEGGPEAYHDALVALARKTGSADPVRA